MEIKAVDGNLSLGSLFKPVAVGYAIGMGVFMLPMLLLMIPIFIFSPGVETQSGELVTGPISILVMLLPMFVMFPIILVLQGFLIGGAVIFGLYVYRTRKPISVAVLGNQ